MLIIILSNILNFGLFSLVCNLLFEMRYNKKVYFCIFTIAVSMNTIVNISLTNHWNFISMFFCNFVLSLVLFKGLLVFKLFTCIFYIIGLSTCELISLNILLSFFEKEQLVPSNSLSYVLGIISSNVIMLIFILIFKSFYSTYKDIYIPKYSLLILILPMTTISFILGINDYYQINSVLNITIFTGLLLSNFISIYIFYKTISYIHREKELKYELMEGNLKYEAVHGLLEQHNKFLHSIRNQTKNMLCLLEEKKYSDLEKYILNIFSQTTKIYNMINSDYEIIDAIINTKIQIINENDINIRIKLESTDFSCDNKELEILFEHLINICISDCIIAKTTLKNIMIKSKRFGKQVACTFIYSSNNVDPIIEIQDEYNIVYSICDKHHIIYSYNYDFDDKLVTFTLLFTDSEDSNE